MNHMILKSLMLLIASSLVACSDSDDAPINLTDAGNTATVAEAPVNIAATAESAGTFSTLLAAADAAELTAALTGDQALTVFAPTDEAFAALPDGTIDFLLQPENKQALTDILLYHVVSGTVLADQAVAAAEQNSSVETLSGSTIQLSLNSGALFINESQVTAADVIASNGVIHVINQVLLPPTEMPMEGPKGLVQTAIEDGRFTTLAAALGAANLVGALQGEGPFTVFAPTDTAFSALPEGTVEFLLQPENKQALADILLYHVVSGAVPSETAITLSSAPTLSGNALNLNVMNGDLFINSSKVIITDIETSNGIIHVIDSVLLPPSN